MEPPAPELGFEKLKQLVAELYQSAESERKAYQELKEAQTRLIETEKLASLGRLVAGVAHEINNPLSFVINNVAVLQRDLKAMREMFLLYNEAGVCLAKHEPELHARVREVIESTDFGYILVNLEGLLTRSRDGLGRIQQIVKDLRDFARVDEGDLQEVDLNAGIRSTFNIVQGQAKKLQIGLELDLAPISSVTGYPAKLNQVILNLVVNAIDASMPGQKVTIGTRPSGDGVELYVEDHGCGIDPSIREKIFDPFFTTKPQGKGTGLGLSISYGIVRMHGGSIACESSPGQGTRFTVRLPSRKKN
jgi:two-component system NtrC family sensor kinase